MATSFPAISLANTGLRVAILICTATVALANAQTISRGTVAGVNEHPGPALRATPRPAWEINPGYRDMGGIVVHGNVLVTGNINGTGGIFGYNTATGARIWRIAGMMRGEPTSDATAVYAVNDVGNYQFRLNKIDPKTGKVLWSVQDSDLGAQDFAPLVAEGRVFVTHRRTGLTAYDAASGKLLWDQKETNACSPGLAYDGGLLYYSGSLTGDRNTLTAVDPATGKAVWSVKPKVDYGDGCTHATAVAQGVVVTRVERWLYAFDAKTGRSLWKAGSDYNGRPWDLSEPTIYSGVVYTSIPSAILGFDLNTGARTFTFPAELAENPVDIRMPVVDGVLYFQGNSEIPRATGNGRGWIYALDLRSGKLLWKYHTAKVTASDPNGRWATRYFTPAGGAIYFESALLLSKLVASNP